MASPIPHDALFRAVSSQKENAIDELKSVLPAHLVEVLDWSSLELQDGHYVDEHLATRQSDLPFAAQLGEDTVLVYLLFEHQRTNDTLMPLRLLDTRCPSGTGGSRSMESRA